MSENENLAALDDEKVIIRGKYLLRVMATATEYRRTRRNRNLCSSVELEGRRFFPDEFFTLYNSLDTNGQI